MKAGLSLLLTVLLALQASALEVRAPRRGGGQGRLGQGQGQNNGNTATASASATASAGGNNSTNTGGGNVAAANGNNGNNGASTNPQDSLTLDPSVICTACTDDGQNPPVDQQSASLTSSNNFINFCNGKTLTNGQQLVDGSCNGVVYGDIIPSANMPAAKITFPPNGGTFAADTQFTFTMKIQNMVTGNFVNANTNYYGAPQQLQGGTTVIGHSHVTVEKLPAIDSTTPLDPTAFTFFKGINTADNNGVLSVDVTAGLPAGVYRFCTINTNANHTPVMVAIAQHGSLDDCIYATAVAGGGGGGNNNGTGNVADASSTAANAASTTAADAASTTAAANASTPVAANASTTTAAAAATSSAAGGNQGGRNRGGQGRGGRGRGRGRHPHKRETSKVYA